MNFTGRCLAFFSTICISYARAQAPDSTILFSSTASEEMFGLKQSSKSTDTILDNIQNYYQPGVLGNIGLPSYSLLAKDNSANPGFFNWMNLNNSNDLFTDKRSVYFRPSGKIYTKIFAAMGQKQEQVFKIQHSQNIKRVNISLLFNRYSCFGFYLNQKTITDNLLVSSHYKTANGRWGYNTHLIFNKLKYQLNGGIQSDTLLGLNPFVDKQLFPVNLSATRQNLKTASFTFSTFFRLNKSDSSTVSHYLVYEGNYQSNYWIHAEGNTDTSKYAHNYFYSATGANLTDSAYVKGLSNNILYKINAGGKFVLYAGYKSEFNHYRQANTDTLTLSHVARAGVCLNLENNLLAANLQYAAAGFNQGNYMADFSYTLTAGKNFYFDAKVNASQQMAPFNVQRYYSSHFIWDSSLKNIITQNGSLVFGSMKYRFSLGAFVQQQRNAVYFDTLALPKQYTGSAVNGRFFIQKDLRLWHLHLNNIINYQPDNNTDFIRLPNIYSFSQLYYEGKLFKKNLWLQAGVQARYISSFRGNAYMPATNQFYLQNNKDYGSYVFIDVFINAQIDRFRFFIMAQHANQGLMGSYMLAPNYPMPDRSFKAGLVWMFFD